MAHPMHRPGARNPKLTEGELRAVLQALDIVNTTALEVYRAEFEDHQWRALQRGAAKLAGALPPKG